MTRFPATLDTTAKMVTVAVCFILVIPFVKIGEDFVRTGDFLLLIAPVLIILALVWAALYRPTYYMVDGQELRIHRISGAKSIALSEIQEVKAFNKEEMGFGLRTFGSGGAFGYLGKFWYKNAGHLTMYVTDRSKMIVVRLKNGKKIVVSPDDTAGFLKLFHK